MRHVDELKARSKTHVVVAVSDGQWLVTSGRTGNEYTVTALEDGHTCTCKWADPYGNGKSRSKSGCSHVLAVVAHELAEADRRMSVHDGEVAARKQHRPMIDLGQGLFVTARR